MLLLAGAPAAGAPRLTLLVSGFSEAEVELAKLRLEGADLEPTFLEPQALEVQGRFLELEQARAGALEGWTSARDHFFAARFALARSTADAARAAAEAHAGDPLLARTLARLDLLAAQCGDPDGFRRAAAHFPSLQLDEAQWSPEVRAGFERARAAQAASPVATLEVSTQPEGASVFANGQPLGKTPLSVELPVKEHALLLFADGFAPIERTVRLEPRTTTPVSIPLPRAVPEELFAGIRLRLQLGGELPSEELLSATRKLGVDALVVLEGGEADRVGALVVGPGVARASFTRKGPRLGALRELMDELRGQITRACAIAHQPPERGRAGGPLALGVGAGPCIETVSGAFRPSGAAAWNALAATRPGEPLELPLPSSDRPSTVEYYLWGQTKTKGRVSGAGSEHSPLRVPIEADRAPASVPFYRTAWFWSVVGGAAAATAVTLVVLPGPGSTVRL